MRTNSIMHNKYTRQPEKLRAWKSASTIERVRTRDKKAVVNLAGKTSTPPAKAA